MLNLAGLGLPLVVAVFAMPVVVDGLGPARFGILALVWVVLGYMALLDLGLGRATTKFAADALATGDHRRIASSARVAAGLQVVVGILAGAGLALAVPLLVDRLLEVPPALEPEARSSFYLLALVTPVLLVTNTFRGLLEAAQRFDLVNAVRLPASTANFLIPLIGVLVGWSLPLIVAVMLVVRGAVFVTFLVLSLSQYPGLLGLGGVRRGEVGALLGFGGWLTLSSLVSPLLVYLDRFLIGGLVSLAAVGYYSAPHEIVMRLTLLPSALVATLFPALSAASEVGDGERLHRLVAGSLKFVLIGAGPLMLTLAALAPEVLGLWLGPAFAQESGLALRLLACGMLINAAAYIANVLLQAVGRPDLPAKFHLLELPVHLAVLWLFVSAWGITGAAAAWALRMALDATLLFTAAGRLGLLSGRSLRAFNVPATLLLLAGFGLTLAAVTLTVPAVGPRLLVVSVLLLGLVGAIWLGILDASERETLIVSLRPRDR